VEIRSIPENDPPRHQPDELVTGMVMRSNSNQRWNQ